MSELTRADGDAMLAARQALRQTLIRHTPDRQRAEHLTVLAYVRGFVSVLLSSQADAALVTLINEELAATRWQITPRPPM